MGTEKFKHILAAEIFCMTYVCSTKTAAHLAKTLTRAKVEYKQEPHDTLKNLTVTAVFVTIENARSINAQMVNLIEY